jgi:hypothetical protein
MNDTVKNFTGGAITAVVTEEERAKNPYAEEARIVVPDEETQEAVLKRIKKLHICGHCRHFDLRMGQEEFVSRQEVFKMAYNSLEHDPAWYGRTDMYGACHEWDGHMVHQFAPITIPSHFLNSDLPFDQRDQPVECPYFVEKKHARDVATSRLHYVGKRRNYEG